MDLSPQIVKPLNPDTIEAHHAWALLNVTLAVLEKLSRVGDIFTDAPECANAVSGTANLLAFVEQFDIGNSSLARSRFAVGRVYDGDAEIQKDVTVFPDGTLSLQGLAGHSNDCFAFVFEADACSAECSLFGEVPDLPRRYALKPIDSGEEFQLRIVDIVAFHAQVVRREMNLADLVLASLGAKDRENDLQQQALESQG